MFTVWVLEPGHLKKINQSGRYLKTKDSNFFPERTNGIDEREQYF